MKYFVLGGIFIVCGENNRKSQTVRKYYFLLDRVTVKKIGKYIIPFSIFQNK